MLKPDQKVAVFMQGYLHSDFGKMGLGVLRYLTNPIVGVIDSEHAGSNINLELDLDRNVPICATLNEVIEKGAEVLILGIAPSGGQIPQNWMPVIEAAILKGLSIVNGLHDNLNDKFKKKIQNNVNQWIWDVRTPQFVPDIATAKASDLPNKRVLMIGTDMAVGKMTAGLEIYHWAKQRKINTGFIATGQNWNGKDVTQTQKEILQFFGFKTPNELFWNWQFTDNALDETKRSYNKAITTFDKTFLKPYDNIDLCHS